MEDCEEYGNSTVDCSQCHKRFTRFGIKRHGDKCHGPQTKVFSCADCGKRGKSRDEIKKHQAAEHRVEEVERSREVCKHWRQGNCFKGNRCMFSHVGHQENQSSNFTSTPRTSTTSLTPACKQGESCEWMAKGSCCYFHRGIGEQKPSSRTCRTCASLRNATSRIGATNPHAHINTPPVRIFHHRGDRATIEPEW